MVLVPGYCCLFRCLIASRRQMNEWSWMKLLTKIINYRVLHYYPAKKSEGGVQFVGNHAKKKKTVPSFFSFFFDALALESNEGMRCTHCIYPSTSGMSGLSRMSRLSNRISGTIP